VYAPACTFVVPASNPGSNGRGSEHGVPFGPVVIWNFAEGSAAGVPDHGSTDDAVVYVPHDGGVLNGALAVPKKLSLKSLNGNCGVSSNVVTICPVTGSNDTCPATFTRTPATGSSNARYNAINDPNGFSSCVAKYA
jgi:hypothetical protein